MTKKRHWNEARLGAFIILILAAFAYLSLKIGRFNVGEDLTVTVLLDDASGLVTDGAVMLAGVRVGTIYALSVEYDKAKVGVRLRSDAKIRKDARATVRMKSLLGEKFLEIIPQSKDAPLLVAGDRIEATFLPTEIDQLVNRLASIAERIDANNPEDGNIIDNFAKLSASLRRIAEESRETFSPTMKNLRDMTAELKDLLAENKAGMKDTLTQVHDLAENANRIVKANEAHLDRIADSVDKTTAAFAPRSEEIAKNLDETLKNLVRITEKLPATLDSLTRVSSKFETTLDRAGNLLGKLEGLDEKTIRRFLQEEGITINLFSRKVEGEEDREAQKKKEGKEKKDRGWLIFPKRD